MKALLQTACVLALLAGCAPVAEPQRAQSTQSQATPRVARVAMDLASADLAFETSATSTLAPLVRALREQGAHPLADGAPDRVAQWEAAAGLPATPPMRGRVLGPGYSRGRLGPGENAVLQQTFFSGQKTALSVGERKTANLRLRLYDADSRLVCEHVPAHGRVCRFTPIFTQRYKIEIRNEGKRDAVYYLAVE